MGSGTLIGPIKPKACDQVRDFKVFLDIQLDTVTLSKVWRSE